jgi:hypothetical protein
MRFVSKWMDEEERHPDQEAAQELTTPKAIGQ